MREAYQLHEAGKLAFRCSHRFNNRIVATATIQSEATSIIEARRQAVLEKVQGKSLTLADMQGVMQQVGLAMHSRITASNMELLTKFQHNSLKPEMFFDASTATIAAFLAENSDDRAIARFMEPVMDTVKKTLNSVTMKDVNQDVTADYSTENTTKTNFGIKWEVVDLGLDSTTKRNAIDKVVDAVKTSHGVTLNWDETSSQFNAQGITIYRLKEGWQKTSVSSIVSGAVGLGEANNYFEESPVPSQLSIDAVQFAIQEQSQTAFYDGVPIGTVLPYYGRELPRGYRWADGNSVWPKDERWVPDVLKGRKVPDLRGAMLGGTESFDDDSEQYNRQTGTYWNDGIVDLTDVKVPQIQTQPAPNRDFCLTTIDRTSSRRHHTGDGYRLWWKTTELVDGPVVNQKVQKKREDFFGEIEVRTEGNNDSYRNNVFLSHLPHVVKPLEDRSLNGNARLNSSKTLPPHWRCRFIIKFAPAEVEFASAQPTARGR